MNRSIHIFLHQSFTEQYGILVVITFPCHKSNQWVFTKGDFAAGSRRSISNYLTSLNFITFCNNRSLVHAGTLVASYKFRQFILIQISIFFANQNAVCFGTFYHTAFFCYHTVSGVNSRFHFHTCSDNRRLCYQKWHCLTLHVGTHQSTVRIIIFQEWNHGCCHREYHLWRYVHVINFISLKFRCLFTETTGYIFTNEMTFFVQTLIRLCNVVTVFFVCRHINNFICYTWILRIRVVYFTIWSLNKSILVNSCVRCQ